VLAALQTHSAGKCLAPHRSFHLKVQALRRRLSTVLRQVFQRAAQTQRLGACNPGQERRDRPIGAPAEFLDQLPDIVPQTVALIGFPLLS
jgi:hypothetical protein